MYVYIHIYGLSSLETTQTRLIHRNIKFKNILKYNSRLIKYNSLSIPQRNLLFHEKISNSLLPLKPQHINSLAILNFQAGFHTV